MDRQIRYYKYSENGPERHVWNFLLINQKGEIEKIKQKIYNRLVSIVEEKVIDSGKIKDSILSYELLSLITTSPKLDFSEIYRGKVKLDRQLSPRKTSEGWNNLIDKVYSGKLED